VRLNQVDFVYCAAQAPAAHGNLWYLARGVDIETVSMYCGVPPATIRKTCRHVMPGTFDPIMDAARHFGR
jgi:hypothetical protein